MKHALVFSLAALLAGCSGQANVQVNGPNAAPPAALPGVSVAGGSLSASIQGTSTLGALIGLAILSMTAAGEPSRSTVVPALDPSRAVNEQDCSRPIADPSANLKCR